MANHALAQKDAEELLAYKKTKHKSNEEMIFHRILTRRSFSHIRAINRAIETTGSNDLTKLVYKHFSGDHLVTQETFQCVFFNYLFSMT